MESLNKASPDQKHAIENLVMLLTNGGFFRDANGLNSLPTFKHFAQKMNKQSGFTVSFKAVKISEIMNQYPTSMSFILGLS